MKRATFITWEQLKVGGMILLAMGILTVAVFKLGEAANLGHGRGRLKEKGEREKAKGESEGGPR